MKRQNQDQPLSIEGRNPVFEALQAKLRIDRLLIDSGAKRDDKIDRILTLAQSQGIKCERTNRRYLDRRARTGVHQGVIALARTVETPSINQLLTRLDQNQTNPFFLIFPSIVYEHNLGAVIRTAEAAGAHAVIVPNRSVGLTPVVIRASMGACFWIPLIQLNLFNTLRQLTDQGLRIVGTEAGSGEDYWSVDLTGPTALVIGGEDQGLSGPVRNYCQTLIRIPMVGQTASLNLSVATALILYERLRQLKVKTLIAPK